MAGGRWRMARVPVNERPVLDREEEDGRWKTKRMSADNVFGLIESDGEDNGSLICLNGRGRVGRPQLHRLFRCCRLRSLANGSPFDRRLARTSHFGRSGRKWSGRVWGSLRTFQGAPSATTSVGLDESGPAECGGHLRTFQRYHPRPLRSVWTKLAVTAGDQRRRGQTRLGASKCRKMSRLMLSSASTCLLTIGAENATWSLMGGRCLNARHRSLALLASDGR